MPEIFPFTPALTENAGTFWSGLLFTLGLFGLGLIGALVIGTVVAVARTWAGPILGDLGTAYVEFFRNTPLLVQLIFIQTLLSPAYLGITRVPFIAAAVGLAIYTGAYVAEVLRAGILSVDTRQLEAARSLGLSQPQAVRHVVLPQAVRSVIPPLGNLAIALTKNSAVAAGIAVPELLRAAQTIENRTLTFDGFFAAALAFWAMAFGLAFLFGRLERRYVFAR